MGELGTVSREGFYFAMGFMCAMLMIGVLA